METTYKHPNFESLRFEKNRFDTFTNWPKSWLSPSELAANGFYYLGTGDKCQCVFCGGRLSNWEFSDTPSGEHQRHYPLCPFVKGQSVGNVPMTEAQTNQYPSLINIIYDGTDSLQNTSFQSNAYRHPNYERLRFEKNRFDTFTNWPKSWLSPSELAANGFFFMGTADTCQCVFCGGRLNNWKTSDTPSGEHRRHYPRCPFVKGQLVGNIPMTKDQANQYSKKGNVVYDGNASRQSISFQTAAYSVMEDRLITFDKWPRNKSQIPRELAKAGFFYCGPGDCVQCFKCNGKVNNWETTDEPWQEHARWFPNCNYLYLNKGQVFIDQAQRQRPLFSSSNNPAKTTENENNLDVHMKSEVIQTVCGMGFTSDVIREALCKKKKETGTPFSSVDSCIDALTMKEAKESHEKSSKSPTVTFESSSAHSSSPADEETESYESKICKICMEVDMDTVFLPCKHMATCATCAAAVDRCPICRSDIDSSFRPIFC